MTADDFDFMAWNHVQDAGGTWEEAEASIVRTHPHWAEHALAYRANFAASLVGEVPGTVDLVRGLHSAGVPMWGLTNWSARAYPQAPARFPFLDLLDAVVVSGTEGVAKPDAAVFEIVVARSGLSASRLVFVDDREDNVAAALGCGLDGIVFTGAETSGPPSASAACQSDPVRIAVVGLGMAGSTLACLLADRGLDVTVLEQEDDPRPVGAGIWLQHLGQQVLDRLGLLDDLRAASRTVARVDIRTSGGRPLLALGYDDVPGEVPALGVHRGTLFTLLHEAVVARGVSVELAVPVTGVRPVVGGLAVETANGDHGTYDLVVGCDGSGLPSGGRWT